MQTRQLQQIIGAEQIAIAIEKMVDDIVVSKPKLKRLVLVGIMSKGYELAQRMKGFFQLKSDMQINVYPLDITFYRDDLMQKGSMLQMMEVEPLPNLEGETVILVDDVLYEGRTMRAALSSLMDYGRLGKLECAVLIDRGHRKMPIQAHFVGFYVETRLQDYIRLRLLERDGVDEILLETQG